MKFVLTLPPPLNQTYGVNRKADFPLYKRKFVKDWEFAAGWELKKQRMGTGDRILFSDKVCVDIVWFYQFDRDIDAALKVLLDLLEKQRVVKNDRQIRELTMKIYEDISRPRVEVEINEIN